MIKNLFCTPKLRPATTGGRKSTRRLSPAMSLLDRLREAVFRLIMLSALSKGGGRRRSPVQPPDQHCHYYPNDPHHNEAVADCIEFIKKSATAGDGGHQDSAAAQALPVMR